MKKTSLLVLCFALFVSLFAGCGTAVSQVSSPSVVSVASSSSTPIPTSSSHASSVPDSTSESITPEPITPASTSPAESTTSESTTPAASTPSSEILFTEEVELREISFVLDNIAAITEKTDDSITFVYKQGLALGMGHITVLGQMDMFESLDLQERMELTFMSVISGLESKQELYKSNFTVDGVPAIIGQYIVDKDGQTYIFTPVVFYGEENAYACILNTTTMDTQDTQYSQDMQECIELFVNMINSIKFI